MKTTLRKLKSKIANNEDVGFSAFLKSINFHIPSLEEMKSVHTDAELDNAMMISDMCEDYSILEKPMLPKFSCPNDFKEEEFLREL